MSTPERRAVPRFASTLSVSYRDGDRLIAATTQTIGRHGVFVCTPNPRRPGELIQLDLCIPPTSDHPLRRVKVMAVVSWTVGVGDSERLGSPTGMGIRFFMLGAVDKDIWDGFVTSLMESSGDEWPREEARELDKAEAQSEPLSKENEPIRFLVRARNLGHLKAFGEKELASGQMFLRTPLMRPLHEPVRVVLIHPVTEEELPVDGRVARRIAKGPITARGMDIELLHAGRESMQLFDHFVKSGGVPVNASARQRLAM